MPDFEGISALTQRECYQAGLEVGIARWQEYQRE
jgi:hypothetical protein